MQILATNLADVTNGSTAVSIEAGVDLTGVVPGCLFKIQGELQVYKIVTVNGRNLTLNIPYAGDTGIEEDGIIQLSVTPNKGLPIVLSGEVDANELISYGFSLLD